MDAHLKLHATQLKQLTQTQTHPLHDLNAYLNPPRNRKATIFPITVSIPMACGEETSHAIGMPKPDHKIG